jgi:hypothetical protein
MGLVGGWRGKVGGSLLHRANYLHTALAHHFITLILRQNWHSQHLAPTVPAAEGPACSSRDTSLEGTHAPLLTYPRT